VPKNPDKATIQLLNEVLTGELTAVNQYFCHARMCASWGFTRLASHIQQESIDEMKHAQALIDRVLYLGGVPNVQRLGKINIGETVTEQFKSDLAVEMESVQRLNAAIAKCTEMADNNTRTMLEKILHEEEEHVDWIESQLELIRQVGEQNYLARQIH
jgi:bacterioferritin